MTVRIYRSTDAGSPNFGNSGGTLVDVLKACLVTGYGTGENIKTPAGWSLAIDEVGGNNQILLCNAGSGRYWKIKDDGIQESTQVTPNYSRATITGAISYTDIDTLITPFPRTITGTDRDSNTWYGSYINKGSHSAMAWILIADEATCYFIHNLQNNQLDASQSVIHQPGNIILAFGDLKPLGNVTGNPKAFLHADDFYIPYSGSGYYGEFGTLSHVTGYMEHGLYDSSMGTRFVISPGLLTDGVSQSGATFSAVNYSGCIYPSPITGGLVLEKFIICDYTESTSRPAAFRYASFWNDRFATYAGVYACLHSVFDFASYYKVCDPFDIVTAGGRDYLIFTHTKSTQDYTLAIDLTGPW